MLRRRCDGGGPLLCGRSPNAQAFAQRTAPSNDDAELYGGCAKAHAFTRHQPPNHLPPPRRWKTKHTNFLRMRDVRSHVGYARAVEGRTSVRAHFTCPIAFCNYNFALCARECGNVHCIRACWVFGDVATAAAAAAAAVAPATTMLSVNPKANRNRLFGWFGRTCIRSGKQCGGCVEGKLSIQTHEYTWSRQFDANEFTHVSLFWKPCICREICVHLLIRSVR